MAGFSGQVFELGDLQSASIPTYTGQLYLYGIELPDAAAPTVSAISPTPGTISGNRQTAKYTPITFTVSDINPGLRLVAIAIKYSNQQQTVLIYDGTSFLPPFNNSKTSATGDANSMVFELLPDGGWADTFNLIVFAIDQAGNLTP